MRITEKQLRQIIREEVGQITERMGLAAARPVRPTMGTIRQDPRYKKLLSFVMGRNLPGIHPDDVKSRWESMFGPLVPGELTAIIDALQADGALDQPAYYESRKRKGRPVQETSEKSEAPIEEGGAEDEEGILVPGNNVAESISRRLREAYGEEGWVGGLTASIAGDTAYTDRMDVWFEDNGTVTISVSESTPGGGMDMRRGVHTMASEDIVVQQFDPDRLPGEVLAAIKRVINNNKYSFKRYGLPTKNFRWADRSIRGLSLASVTAALEAAGARAGI